MTTKRTNESTLEIVVYDEQVSVNHNGVIIIEDKSNLRFIYDRHTDPSTLTIRRLPNYDTITHSIIIR